VGHRVCLVGFCCWFNAFAGGFKAILRGLTAGSSWIIHLYTNDRMQMSFSAQIGLWIPKP
jgi:hypothetical protein